MSDKKNETVITDKALEPYWAAAREGKLLLKHCLACGKTHYYPRPICPFCMSDNTEWLEASGNGIIYSWSVERRATPPYAMAFVTLAEGPTIMTNIVECDLNGLAIGQKVKLCFETREDQPTPVFKLVND